MANTYDLYVTIKPPDQVKNLQIFDFGGTTPVAFTGFYKSILQWLKCLFTEVGTDLSDSTYGSPLALLVGGAVSSTLDAKEIAIVAIKQATDKIRTYQLANARPANEMISSVTVTNIAISTQQINIYVTIKNAAGELLSLSIPTSIRPPPTL